MPSLSTYTPLEVFLFFQSLASLDAKPSNFSPVSDLLKNNSFVREDVTFDPERLGPQALEELYATLLRDGVEDTTTATTPKQNGQRSESPGSSFKRRKIPSPSRRGPDDAMAHSTVVPSLVSHLYAKYKERVTRDIQNEEKRYREIREEIKRLENGNHGEVDGVVPARPEKQEEPVAPPKDAMGVDAGENQPRPRDSRPVEGPVGAAEVKASQAEQNRERCIYEQQKVQEPLSIASKAPAGDNGYPRGDKARAQQEKATPHVVQQQPQNVPYMATGHPPPQTSPLGGSIPFLPPPQQSGHGYRLTSPSASSASHTISPHSQQQTQSQPAAGTVGVFGPGHANNPQRSPVILPPPGLAAPLSAQSPSRGTLGEAGSNHHRTPSLTHQYSSPQHQIPQGLPTNFQQPWSPRDSPQTPYPHISPYANAPYSSNHHVAGRALPPFNSTPYGHPDNARAFQSPYAHPGQMLPGGPAGFGQSPHQSVEGSSFSPAGPARSNKNTPSQTPSFSSRRPPRLPSLDTTGSLTPWKKTPLRIDTSKSPGSPVQPRPEDVSPISERAPSPPFETPQPESASRKPAQRTSAKVTKSGKRKTVPPLELRNVPPYDSQNKTSPVLRNRRGGSAIPSPVAASSTRSRGRSITSRGDESVTDPGSATQRKIKHEVPSTPAAEMSEDADVESRASTRRRAAAAHPEESGVSHGRTKRKRGTVEPSETEDTPQQPPLSARPSSQYVLCTRNFPRTSAPIMNDVTAHKHASIFAKPLTERDAPGYKDLIFRPQDLKSIKSAIHQGSRAVTAATEAASTPAADGESPGTGTGPGTGAGTPSKNAILTLKKTAELIPPKGIINSPQLEKELMRMFANAVMFNPTPERSFGPSFPMSSDAMSREGTQVSEPEEGGIINDTREMCDDVELAVTRWRAAERTADGM